MIVIPFFSAYHAPFLEAALAGFDGEWRFVSCSGEAVVSAGLEAVNNDACFAALLAAGRVVVEGREHSFDDANSISRIVVPVPCVSCRGDEGGYLVARALEAAGLAQQAEKIVDACALLNKAPNCKHFGGVADALAVGDALLQTCLRVRPYLDNSQAAAFETLLEQWRARACEELALNCAFDLGVYLNRFDKAVNDFGIPARDGRPVIGMVGSAPALFDIGMNDGIIASIEHEGCEVAIPYLVSLFSYLLRKKQASDAVISSLDERIVSLRYQAGERRVCPSFTDIERSGMEVLPAHRVQGPGLTVAGYARLFVEGGVRDLAYIRAFGCLAGHVVGQGAVKRLRFLGDHAGLPINIATIEFDPGTSSVNQVNRIKLMAAVAKRSVGLEVGSHPR